jgi:hypothetical protein
MKQFVKKQPFRSQGPEKTRTIPPRNFYLDIQDKLARDLSYFVGQELAYYNTLVTQLMPKLKAYPRDILAFRDKDRALWDSCAEHSIDPHKLVEHPLEAWPQHLQHMHKMLYDYQNNLRYTSMQLMICAIAATPARLPALVRKSMAAEVMNYMMNQADVLIGAMKVDDMIQTGKLAEGSDIMRVPLQLLQTHTVDSKRHLQIPRSLVKIAYDKETEASNITVPYSRTPITIENCDLSESFYKLLVLRAPHPTSPNQKWQIEFRDGTGQYQLTMTDYMERKRGKR